MATFKARKPSNAELKDWESKAGLEHAPTTDVGAGGSNNPQGRSESSGAFQIATGDSKGAIAAGQPRVSPKVIEGSDSSSRSDKFTLGKLTEAEHAKTYNEHPINQGKPSWDELTVNAKAGWKSSAAGGKAIAEATRNKAQNPPADTRSYDAKRMGGKRAQAQTRSAMFTDRVQEKMYNVTGKLLTGARIQPAEDRPTVLTAKRTGDDLWKDPTGANAVDRQRTPTYSEKSRAGARDVFDTPEGRKSLGRLDPTPEITPTKAMHPNAPTALSSDFSHHQGLDATVSKIVTEHTEAHGGLSASHPIAQAARSAKESLALSAKAHSLGDKEGAIAHMTNAVQSSFTAAKLAHGVAANSGQAVGPMSPHVKAIADHMVNYKKSIGA